MLWMRRGGRKTYKQHYYGRQTNLRGSRQSRRTREPERGIKMYSHNRRTSQKGMREYEREREGESLSVLQKNLGF